MAGGAIVGGVTAGIGAMQMLDAKNRADALKRQAEFEARQQEFNAQLVQLQTEEIFSQAETDAQRRQEQVNQMIGAQKVSLAAQGIEVEGELGAQFEQDERQFGVDDVQAIKNNAWRQAMGLEIQASDLQTSADFIRLGGKSAARQTLVTGGLQGLSNVASGAARFRG